MDLKYFHTTPRLPEILMIYEKLIKPRLFSANMGLGWSGGEWDVWPPALPLCPLWGWGGGLASGVGVSVCSLRCCGNSSVLCYFTMLLY